MADRITERLQELRMSVPQFGKAVGVSRTTAHKWATEGHGIRGPNLIRAARVLQVHAVWLDSGKGPKLLSDTVPESLGDQLSAVDAHMVPLISLKQAEGWSEIADTLEIGSTAEWVSTTAHVSQHSFALRVHGDSMEPMIAEGSVVIVDPALLAGHNDIVVARITGSPATLRRLVIDGPRTYLAAENSRYDMIPADGELTIIGVVIKVEMDVPHSDSGRKEEPKTRATAAGSNSGRKT